MKKILKGRLSWVILFAAVAVIGVLWLIFRPPCPIKHITGLSCAGCGMTRALFSALCFDLVSAFEYHPLWVLVLPFGVLFAFFAYKKKSRAVNILLTLSAVLLFAVWVWRIIEGDGIVAFDFENSLISKMIQKLTELFA